MAKSKVFLLSRTDSIGDMILTLPMAGLLKQVHPGCEVFILGKNYTQPVVECAKQVNGFIDVATLPANATECAKHLKALHITDVVHVFPVKERAFQLAKTGVNRIGTTNRWYHWLTCNQLIRLSRKNSIYHEAQLNAMLLNKSGLKTIPTMSQLEACLDMEAPPMEEATASYISPNKINLILHPKSKGSAKEWGLNNYAALAALLPSDKFNILIGGTQEEGQLIGSTFNNLPHVKNLTGKLSLSQYIALINQCGGLIAASTGPLHIAAALGVTAIGLFSEKRPIHPGRWAPLGKRTLMVSDKNCLNCKEGKACDCITRISPQTIVNLINEHF